MTTIKWPRRRVYLGWLMGALGLVVAPCVSAVGMVLTTTTVDKCSVDMAEVQADFGEVAIGDKATQTFAVVGRCSTGVSQIMNFDLIWDGLDIPVSAAMSAAGSSSVTPLPTWWTILPSGKRDLKLHLTYSPVALGPQTYTGTLKASWS